MVSDKIQTGKYRLKSRYRVIFLVLSLALLCSSTLAEDWPDNYRFDDEVIDSLRKSIGLAPEPDADVISFRMMDYNYPNPNGHAANVLRNESLPCWAKSKGLTFKDFEDQLCSPSKLRDLMNFHADYTGPFADDPFVGTSEDIRVLRARLNEEARMIITCRTKSGRSIHNIYNGCDELERLVLGEIRPYEVRKVMIANSRGDIYLTHVRQKGKLIELPRSIKLKIPSSDAPARSPYRKSLNTLHPRVAPTSSLPGVRGLKTGLLADIGVTFIDCLNNRGHLPGWMGQRLDNFNEAIGDVAKGIEKSLHVSLGEFGDYISGRTSEIGAELSFPIQYACNKYIDTCEWIDRRLRSDAQCPCP